MVAHLKQSLNVKSDLVLHLTSTAIDHQTFSHIQHPLVKFRSNWRTPQTTLSCQFLLNQLPVFHHKLIHVQLALKSVTAIVWYHSCQTPLLISNRNYFFSSRSNEHKHGGKFSVRNCILLQKKNLILYKFANNFTKPVFQLEIALNDTKPVNTGYSVDPQGHEQLIYV
jgi:hypothetical protein